MSASASVKDVPFLQDVSVKFRTASALTNATLLRLETDRDGVIYVLTDRGVARTFGDTLAPDQSFRPLAKLVARDIAIGNGALYYLFEDRWLSNGDSGKPLGHLPKNAFTQLAVADDGAILLGGPGRVTLAHGDTLQEIPFPAGTKPLRLYAHHKEFLVLTENAVYRVSGGVPTKFHEGEGLTCLAIHGDELMIGSHNGFYGVSFKQGTIIRERQTKLPVTDITCLVPVADGVWAGTTRGVFFHRDSASKSGTPALPDGPNGIRYYASKRWLADDAVVDLKVDGEGNVLVLTQTALNKIEFRRMTLAEKAKWFDRKMRSRHVRFGLAGERRLLLPGDLTSSEIIDTDNDGGWSSYYLGSQAFRYAATGSSQARSNAWEIFAALERLRTLPNRDGFFARTIERAGFRFSDPDRWRELPGSDWEWKGHTSSDEFTSHTFAHAVMWELVAKTESERRRIAANYTAILDHIIRNNWYLIDVDGKPTLWGRWHPEYVNHYPHTIGDRRLNSAEIIAGLQLAWKMTGRETYRTKAYELFDRHGYLTNILSPMSLIGPTPGYVHLGNDMGDEWNHSDDELAFVNYWTLHCFAFTRTLRTRYAAAIREHWEFERPEKFAIWNFIQSACGGGHDCDAEGAVWSLRGVPLDTITWRIQNSHRQDLTRLPKNFYGRESKELLPPGERPVTRLNTQPFILDGGDGGRIELPGDEFLFGYWLGRYLGEIR
ncbi:MAG TPA: hypothetical protein VJ063_13710 [Verrucomicrobiae bacterium]|nr:hypothetical protein [Verrucomicrobiae bacterium]